MLDSEVQYNSFSAEQLAITASLEHFYTLLKGSKVTVYTDHMPIVKAASRQKDKNTLSNLTLKMNKLNLDIEFIKGASNPADILSRCALSDEKNNLVSTTAQVNAVIDDNYKTFSLDQWRQAQQDDPVTEALRNYCVNQTFPRNKEARKIAKVWGPHLAIDPTNQILFFFGSIKKRSFPSRKIVVPRSMQTIILSNFHGTKVTGHFSAPILVDNILQSYWWPQLTIHALDFVRACPGCYQNRDRRARKTKRPLGTWPTPTSKNMRIHADLLGPLRNTHSDNTWVLTISDAFTRWCVLVPLPNKQASSVASAIMTHWILQHGAFATLVSDNGGEFANAANAGHPPESISTSPSGEWPRGGIT